jgi:hypothetical protein
MSPPKWKSEFFSVFVRQEEKKRFTLAERLGFIDSDSFRTCLPAGRFRASNLGFPGHEKGPSIPDHYAAYPPPGRWSGRWSWLAWRVSTGR